MSEQNPKRTAGFRIDNGFSDTKSRGCILVGVLLNGEIKKGDLLILNDGIKIPIDKIEPIIIKGLLNQFSLEISEDNSNLVSWFNYYGKEIDIERE